MASNTHIIHRVNLEIEVPNMRLANQLKDDALRLLYNEILPKLEKYMDTLVPVDEHVQFNQLNINLENISEEHFEKEFTRLIIQVFNEKTEKVVVPTILPKDQINEEEVVKYTKGQLALESFLFFLETGRLPWWSEKSGELLHEQNLSKVLFNSSSEFAERLLSLISYNTFALERLLNQFSIQFIFQNIFQSASVQKGFAIELLPGRIIILLQNFIERKKSEGLTLSYSQQIFIKRIIRQIINNEGVFSEQKLLNFFDELSAEVSLLNPKDRSDLELLLNEIRQENKSAALKKRQDSVVQEVETVAENIQKETTSSTFKDQQVSDLLEAEADSEIIQKEINSTNQFNQIVSDFQETETVTRKIQKEISKKFTNSEKEEDGIFMDNAGLVLLHPFFESFFTNFELLIEGQFKNIESQTLAVHLLHYLATKEELAAEYELVMEKFLCSWDPDLPIDREVTLSKQMKDESETLLKAAIKHWSALKNTSPDGLREGFIQREGKLILNDFQDRLIVESKAQDVLLSYLPWGYGIIKLPWKEMPFYVEWQSSI